MPESDTPNNENSSATAAVPPSGSEKPPTSSDKVSLSNNQIHIEEPGQKPRQAPIPSAGLSIGRDPQNTLRLNDISVSRFHARLEFDGKTYRITDLDSQNGSSLGGRKLNPNESTIWNPDEQLLLGKVTLRLEMAEQSQLTTYTQIRPESPKPPAPVTRLNGSMIDASKVHYSQDKKSFEVAIESTTLSISPGAQGALSFIIINHGSQGDVFQLALPGVAPAWIEGQSMQISVPAGSQREVQLNIRPPRSPNTRAGRLPASLQVASRNAPSQTVEIKLTFTITAFSQFTGKLEQQSMMADGANHVTVDNQGNLPENFSLTWEDPSQTVTFEPGKARLTVPQGQSGGIKFSATLNKPHWIGPDRQLPYQLTISPATGSKEIIEGEVISRSILSTKAWIGLLGLLAITACLTIIFAMVVLRDNSLSDENTDADAVATVVSATKNAAAIATALQATNGVATATIIWQTLDDDQDGLTNQKEFEIGTYFDNPDSDADGLKDGDEVNKWKTDPLKPDTDGDTLSDGEEINNRNTQPLQRDTDGDGLDDNIDLDPVHFPTATSISTFTSTPQPTTTPTPPPTAPVLTADLVVSFTDNQDSSIPGTDIVYTLIVANQGPGSIVAGRLSNIPPETLSKMQWGCNPSLRAKCYVSSGQGAIDIQFDLPDKETITLTANARINPDATGFLINTASVELPPGMRDPNIANNLAMDTDTLTPRVSLLLSNTDGRDEIAPGRPISYTINVTNNGPSTAAGITIIDNFPEMIEGVSWTCSASQGSICTIPGPHQGNINTIINVQPNGYVTIIANGSVTRNAKDKIINTVYLTSPIDPGTNDENISDSTTVINRTDLQADVIASSPVAANTIFTYTINVVNNGPVNAQEVTLTNILPDQVELISISPALACTIAGANITCPLGAIPAGNSIRIQIAVQAPAAVPAVLVNQTSISSTQPDPNPLNNQAVTTTQVN